MIRHVINWKLSAEDQTGKDEAFAAIAAAFAPLPHKIPEIKSLQLGRDLAETPGNWDVVLIIDYESTADLAAYQVHPEHEKARAVVVALVSERATVDFEL